MYIYIRKKRSSSLSCSPTIHSLHTLFQFFFLKGVCFKRRSTFFPFLPPSFPSQNTIERKAHTHTHTCEATGIPHTTDRKPYLYWFSSKAKHKAKRKREKRRKMNRTRPIHSFHHHHHHLHSHLLGIKKREKAMCVYIY